MKRLQQMLFKKNSVPTSTALRNQKTGQLTGHDKGGMLTDAENFALSTIGAEYAQREFMSVRSDDIKGKEQMLKLIQRDGYFNLKDIDSTLSDKTTLNTIDILLIGAGIKSDLVTPGLALNRTIEEKKKKDLSSEKYSTED